MPQPLPHTRPRLWLTPHGGAGCASVWGQRTWLLPLALRTLSSLSSLTSLSLDFLDVQTLPMCQAQLSAPYRSLNSQDHLKKSFHVIDEEVGMQGDEEPGQAVNGSTLLPHCSAPTNSPAPNQPRPTSVGLLGNSGTCAGGGAASALRRRKLRLK